MRIVWLASVLAACKAPPEAPEDLGDLSRYLYREWDAEDPEVVRVGLTNLVTFLSDHDLTGNVNDRAWTLPDLTDEDVAGVDHPDRDLTALAGVSVAFESVWPIEDHANVQVQADQTPYEPTAPDHYDRVFVDPTDPSCFPVRGCERLDTVNDATRQNVLMHVTFELFKDFRSLDLDDGWAIISRSWFDQPWPGDDGKVTLFQSYSTDVWIGRGDHTWRFQSLWSESDLGFAASDETVVATVKVATDGIYERVDEQIAASRAAE